jgi:DNA-binding IclR family transcriptional regulator
MASAAANDSVLGKAAALMRALGRDNAGPLGLSELARVSGLNKATAYRLANELSDHRLLERTEDGYRLGPWLFELGQRVPRYYDISHVAAPFAEDLHRATGQTVHLGIREGTEMMYLLKVRDHRGIDRPSRVAGRMPVHCTATGRSLLPFEPSSVLEEVLAAGLEPRTPHTIVHPAALMEAIQEVRQAGTATEHEEVQLGLGAVAAPVFGPDGPVAAIGIVVQLKDGRPEQYRTAVRTSALYLSRIFTGRSSSDGLRRAQS